MAKAARSTAGFSPDHESMMLFSAPSDHAPTTGAWLTFSPSAEFISRLASLSSF
jgi:hypothetical protein